MFVFLCSGRHISLTFGVSGKYNLVVFPEIKQDKKRQGEFMNVLYAKVILYAYAHIEDVAEQIDEIVEKRALSSAMDHSPALKQYERIVSLTYQKSVLYALKLCADDALRGFSEREKQCLDYKYFHRIKREDYSGFDPASRNYFRLQIRLAKKFAAAMEDAGFNDERFERECLTTEFFKEMLKRVKEKENLSRKNKTQKEKEQIKSVKEKIAKNAIREEEKARYIADKVS